MAILDSYHDIGHKASRFLFPALKVLIEQLQKKKEKEFKEKKLKIPKDPSSVDQWLRFDPTLIIPKIHDFLSLHIEVQNNSEVIDIWQGEIWKNFKGNQESSFLRKPENLEISLYVYWFNAFGNSSHTSSTGAIMLACLNLPPEVRMKPEKNYIPAIIPGPKEPNGEQLNCLLRPLVEELKELWKGIHFFPTSNSNSGETICLAILTVIGDIVAIRKITGFISQSGSRFLSFCTIHKDHIEDIETDIWPSRKLCSHKGYVVSWLNFSTSTEQASFFKEKCVLYSILEDLPYWDATKMVYLDIMHNLFLGLVKDHAFFKLCIPESTWKHKKIIQKNWKCLRMIPQIVMILK
ncbi:hypothetical protein O181_085795 [Austropuccinia psidii MF-1]|uniref:Uncharacterized protein n=1 Tax=Austropuccinia psidii MF-1 TaxID=1389203 RepID=A0A9Q3FY86_9BASI|nr:hypothetical protein [Austropuccinia psidii MF-1]